MIADTAVAQTEDKTALLPVPPACKPLLWPIWGKWCSLLRVFVRKFRRRHDSISERILSGSSTDSGRGRNCIAQRLVSKRNKMNDRIYAYLDALRKPKIHKFKT